jgi:hypothetical protein
MSYTNSNEIYGSLRAFFARLKDSAADPAALKTFDNAGVGRFLLDLGNLPPGSPALPVLRDAAALRAGKAGGVLAQRLNRRYLRVRFVQEELDRLDFKKAKPGAAFDDFVFDQIDFSVYNKIPEEEFRLLYIEGLGDFTERFLEKTFTMGREAVQTLIKRGYRRIGPCYYSRGGKFPGFLLLPIMRTLRTSLEFAPLISQEEVLGECTELLRFLRERSALDKEVSFYLAKSFGELFARLLCSLHRTGFTHADGMRTTLTASPSGPAAGRLTLCGTFRPAGKGCTLPLVPTAIRYADIRPDEGEDPPGG